MNVSYNEDMDFIKKKLETRRGRNASKEHEILLDFLNNPEQKTIRFEFADEKLAKTKRTTLRQVCIRHQQKCHVLLDGKYVVVGKKEEEE